MDEEAIDFLSSMGTVSVLDDPDDEAALSLLGEMGEIEQPSWGDTLGSIYDTATTALNEFNYAAQDAAWNQKYYTDSLEQAPTWLSGKLKPSRYDKIKYLESELKTAPDEETRNALMRQRQMEQVRLKVDEEDAAKQFESFTASGKSPQDYFDQLEKERQLKVGSTANLPMPARILANAGLNIGGTAVSLLARLAGEHDLSDEINTEKQQRDYERRVGQNWWAGAGETAGETVATAAGVSALGGPVGLVAYYASSTADQLYSETGDLSYSLAGGAIEGAFTALGMKLGSGTGMLSKWLGGKGASSVMSNAAKRALARSGAPAWTRTLAPVLVGVGGEIIEENATNFAHALNSYFQRGDKKAFENAVNQIAETTVVSGLAGGGGAIGPTASRSLALRERKKLATGMMRAADEIKQAAQGVQAAVSDVEAAQSPVANTVRMYHGGIAPDGSARWVSPDLEYAKGYASKSPGSAVYYVDVPADSPLLQKAFDDTGTDQAAPYVAFEAPADLMAKAKPLTLTVPPTSRNGFEKATGRRNTSEAERNGYIDTVEAFNQKMAELDAEVEAQREPQSKVYDRKVRSEIRQQAASWIGRTEPAQIATPEQQATEGPQPAPESPAPEVAPVAEPAPGASETLRAAMHDAIPGARLTARSPSEFQVDLPNGRFFTLELAPEIKSRSKKYLDFIMKVNGLENTPENRKRIRNRGGLGRFTIGTPDGVMVDGLGVMKILDRLNTERMAKTIRHEAVHVARGFGMFTDAEWDSLVKEHSDSARPLKRQEEDIAKASKLWQGDNSLTRRIKDLLNRFLTFLRVAALNPQAVQRSFVRGDVLRRPGIQNKQAVDTAAMQSNEALSMEQADDSLFDKGPPPDDRYLGRANPGVTDPARAGIYQQDVAHGPPESIPREVPLQQASSELSRDYHGTLAKWLKLAEASKKSGKVIPMDSSKDDMQVRMLINAEFDKMQNGDKEAGDHWRLLLDKFRERRSRLGEQLGIRDAYDPKFGDQFQRHQTLVDAVSLLTHGEALAFGKLEETAATKKLTWDEIKQRMKAIGVDLDGKTLAEVASDTRLTIRMLNELNALGTSIPDRVFEFWRNMILSGPQTQAVNTLGNVAFGQWVTFAEKSLAGVVNLALRNKKDPNLGEVKYALAGTLPGIFRGLRNAALSWRTETPALAMELGQVNNKEVAGRDNMRSYAIPGKLGRAVRAFGYRPLMAADEFSRSVLYQQQVGSLAYRKGVENGLKGEELGQFIASEMGDPMSASSIAAFEAATHLVFQGEAGVLAKKLVTFGRGVRKHTPFGAGKYIAPFIQTPANLYEEMFKRMPVVGAILDYANARAQGKSLKEAGMSTTLARQIIAFAGVAAIMGLMDDDDPWITGANEDYDPLPPQSIKVPGIGWVSYARVQPFSGAISSTADAIKGMRRGKPVATTIQSLANQASDMTYLQGVSDMASAFEEAKRTGTAGGLAKWASNVTTGFVPNLYRQAARGTKNYIPERRIWGEGQDWYDRMAKRMAQDASLRFDTQPKVDIWGRDIPQDVELGGPATDFLFRVLVPTVTKEADMLPMEQAILRYNATSGREGVFWNEPKPTYTVAGESKYMDDEQYRLFQRYAGTLARKRLELIDWKPLIEKPTERTPKIIGDAITKARKDARSVLIPLWIQGQSAVQALEALESAPAPGGT